MGYEQSSVKMKHDANSIQKKIMKNLLLNYSLKHK